MLIMLLLTKKIIKKQKRKWKRKWEREKKKRKKMKCILWHYEGYNIFIIHFIQLYFILLYNRLCVQLFSLYLCCTLINISCYSQYSLMRKIQYCTLLCVLCTHLVDSYMTFLFTLKIFRLNQYNFFSKNLLKVQLS